MNRQKKIEIQSNETQDEQERDDFKTPEGTRREGPPFPNNLSTKSSRIQTPKPTSSEEKGETERRRGGRLGRVGGRLVVWVPGAGREERGEGLFNPLTLD